MKSLRKLFGIVILCSLCVAFTACPGDDDNDDLKSNPPTLIENTGGGNSVNIDEIVKENISKTEKS